MTLKYNLNGVWLETIVKNAYVLGSLVKGYCATKGVKEIQVWCGEDLIIVIEK